MGLKLKAIIGAHAYDLQVLLSRKRECFLVGPFSRLVFCGRLLQFATKVCYYVKLFWWGGECAYIMLH